MSVSNEDIDHGLGAYAPDPDGDYHRGYSDGFEVGAAWARASQGISVQACLGAVALVLVFLAFAL